MPPDPAPFGPSDPNAPPECYGVPWDPPGCAGAVHVTPPDLPLGDNPPPIFTPPGTPPPPLNPGINPRTGACGATPPDGWHTRVPFVVSALLDDCERGLPHRRVQCAAVREGGDAALRDLGVAWAGAPDLRFGSRPNDAQRCAWDTDIGRALLSQAAEEDLGDTEPPPPADPNTPAPGDLPRYFTTGAGSGGGSSGAGSVASRTAILALGAVIIGGSLLFAASRGRSRRSSPRRTSSPTKPKRGRR